MSQPRLTWINVLAVCAEHKGPMLAFVFRCPVTRQQVQGEIQPEARDTSPSTNETTYLAVPCPACGQVHIVNPNTGKLLSEDRSRKPR